MDVWQQISGSQIPLFVVQEGFVIVRRSSAYVYTSKEAHNAAQIKQRDESIKHGVVQCAPVVLPLKDSLVSPAWPKAN